LSHCPKYVADFCVKQPRTVETYQLWVGNGEAIHHNLTTNPVECHSLDGCRVRCTI